jgi:TIR domain/Squalene-hopene cyclase C-terminal domain/Prenyltransferase and squalene oxidase repeat
MQPELSPDDFQSALQRAVAYLHAVQNPDGGYVGSQGGPSDSWATAECILALKSTAEDPGGTDPQIEAALQWLVEYRLADGSWSSGAYQQRAQGGGDVAATAYALRALAVCGREEDRPLIETAREWLVDQQRGDGGWGVHAPDERRSHIGQTGYAISALAWAPAEHRADEAIQDGLIYLYSQQRPVGGWELAPGQEMDATLTAYALRGLVDVCRLRAHRPQPRVFVDWLRNMEVTQNESGTWSDWYGNPASVEAAGYCLELARCVNAVDLDRLTQTPWIQRTARFLLTAQGSRGGWGTQPGTEEVAWVTHSVVIALAKLLGRQGADQVSLSLPADSALGTMPTSEQPVDMYDIALSFSGSDREYASALALRLYQRGATVFYDRFETDTLWGSNLVDRLTSVYRDRARMCIMLVSREYVRRSWPRLERQSAQARALKEGEEYILPVMLEPGVKVDGMPDTIGYISAAEFDIDSIAGLAMRRLERLGPSPP